MVAGPGVGIIANDAIGLSAPDDWRLAPDMHAERLTEAAKSLAPCLRDPRLSPVIDRFHASDARAVTAQARYRLIASLAAYASFAAVLLGTLTLVALPLGIPGPLVSAALAAQAVLVVIGLSAAVLNGWLSPFEEWQTARAEAESARMTLFETLTARPESLTTARAVPQMLRALQLAYFRRYQLDVQRSYYRNRARRHGANAARHRLWRILALVLIVAAGGSLVWVVRDAPGLPEPLASLLAGLPDRTDAGQRLFLALGIWAAALQNLLSSLSLITLDERNACRYATTADNLDALAGQPLREAQEAMSNDPETAERAMRDFVSLVHDQISSEHREWVALRKAVPELTLRQLRRRQPAA